MTKVRQLAFCTLLLIAFFGGIFPTASALASDTPCTDQWASCTRSAEWCDGQWCGCMSATYGYQCAQSLYGGGGRAIDHAGIERSAGKAKASRGNR